MTPENPPPLTLNILSLELCFEGLPAALQEALWLDWLRPYDLPTLQHYQVREASLETPANLQKIPFQAAEVYSSKVEGGVLLACRDNLLKVDFAHQQLLYWGNGPSLRLLFQLGISEVLRLMGFLPLHASAVLLEGGATVLLGKSGTGKTTTLLQAARSGIPALAEDWSWLAEDLTFYPWDRGLHLLPDTAERFEDVLPAERTWMPRGDRHKWHFAVQDLPWFQPAAHPLKAFWMLKRHHTTLLQDLPALEKVRSLWEACGMPLSSEAAQLAQQRINGLLSLPARQLLMGYEVHFADLLNGN
ncbi:hypothetical protein [Deinococcus roseus]|uniref:Serine kinase n=1 Tax=Deinococcus roseus TaxID=392414 RepID=A0ABQ2CWP4_9DEIO|nr:hypothetical protein [Deinococcus roseus]GGJ28310.1 hypothetical protein GCM10008938_12990 [Deinococcus roseus]